MAKLRGYEGKRNESRHFELAISEGGIRDEDIFFEIEATAEITPHTPAQPPSYSSGGQPAEGGYAEVISLTYTDAGGKTFDVSWLIDILPTYLIEAWGQTIYEQPQEGI